MPLKPPNIKDLLSLMRSKTKKDSDLISRAYLFAEKKHAGQMRHSGDPYFVHVFETAKNLANVGMDAVTIAGGLLHDTLEDTETAEEELRKEFGEEILFLVQGATK